MPNVLKHTPLQKEGGGSLGATSGSQIRRLFPTASPLTNEAPPSANMELGAEWAEGSGKNSHGLGPKDHSELSGVGVQALLTDGIV